MRYLDTAVVLPLSQSPTREDMLGRVKRKELGLGGGEGRGGEAV